jgi:hypothetical protein
MWRDKAVGWWLLAVGYFVTEKGFFTGFVVVSPFRDGSRLFSFAEKT